MKKRILSWLLCLTLIVTILPVFSFAAEDGTGSMKVSEAGLDMIKHFEGFSPYPYQDGTQYVTAAFGIYSNPRSFLLQPEYNPLPASPQDSGLHLQNLHASLQPDLYDAAHGA